MKKMFLVILVINILANSSFGQEFSTNIIKSEIKFFEGKNMLKQQRNSTTEFGFNKKAKKNEIKLTIDRIIRNVTPFFTEAIEIDTLKYEGEKFTVDTDNPIPKGEHDADLIESLVALTNKKVVFQEDLGGFFIGPKVRTGSPRIDRFFFEKIPALNKNNFLSPLLLNINPDVKIKIDTVISESYQGVFITSYTKVENGFELNGKLVPLKTTNLETDPNIASTLYEFMNYSGKIKSNAEIIGKMELDVHLKSRLIFKLIKLDETHEEKYRIIVDNSIR